MAAEDELCWPGDEFPRGPWRSCGPHTKAGTHREYENIFSLLLELLPIVDAHFGHCHCVQCRAMGTVPRQGVTTSRAS